MPTPLPYFLDGSSLLDSTSIYLNSLLTIVAPDGWYSDGINTRELLGGVLLPSQPCQSCGFGCYFDIGVNSTRGKYVLNIDTGTLPTNIGAIVITLNPNNVPDGIKATLDGVVYNELSSPIYGYLASSIPGTATFIGRSSDNCGLAGSTYTLAVSDWDGTMFVPTGGTDTTTVALGQLQLTLLNPSNCKMVIPKTTATPSILTIECYSACASAIFDIEIQCPTALDKFKASTTQESVEDPGYCELPLTQNYFVVRLGNATPPYLGLADWVFTDSFGQNKLPNGFYKTNYLVAPNDTIEVANGVIIGITNACP